MTGVMEGVGLAGSVIAITELSAKIIEVCAQYTKDVRKAKKDIERLKNEVESLSSLVKDVKQLLDKTSLRKVATLTTLQPTLDESQTRLQAIQTKLNPSKGKAAMSKFGFRALKWPFQSQDINTTIADLSRLTQAISLALEVDQTTILYDIDRKAVLAKLPIAEGAMHDSHADEHNPQCLPNTRIEVLSEITKWAYDPLSKTVYWLNGMAGTGKSTISRTLAQRFSESNRLGATFFFKRGEGDRGGMSKFFTTIVSQLIRQIPDIAGHIQAIMDVDPTIGSKAMREQFQKLIINPVSKISLLIGQPRTYLIVIDALDECEREEDIKGLINLLSSARMVDLQLKFFLTSRPELPIRIGLKAVNGTYQDFILHEVAEPIIEHDLAVYLKHSLEQVRVNFNQNTSKDRHLSINWPSEADLRVLVQMAIPLFIFAATICRFVGDRKGGNPQKKLQRVLKFRSTQGSKLIATYKPVLEQLTLNLPLEERKEVIHQFQMIVGPIAILASPLSLHSLTELLNISTNDILDILDFLHSVLYIPASPKQPIRLLHLSFRDFLVDQTRQEDPFWINEQEVHRQLAYHCLRVLNSSLKTDICKVVAPGTLASSIPTVEINEHISPELQYACRFWVYHLCESLPATLNMPEIWNFLSSHFLQWLETLSWMKRLPESLIIIQSLLLVISSDNHEELTNFLSDSIRFVQVMKSNIQATPLQVYSSALIFSPKESIIRNLFKYNISSYLALEPSMPLYWSAKQVTFKGHIDWVSSVAYSPDGQRVASASRDKTVILWSAVSGERQATLKGHTDSVWSVAFSPDGQRVASTSSDKTVILWSVVTGRRQATLEGHTGPVWSVAFSSDGQRIASTSDDSTVILWSAATGERQATLKGHTDSVSSVTFSPDGQRVASASASRDKTVILWSAATGERQATLKGHTGSVSSVAFSPDGQRVASASDDGTVILWSAATGERQATLEGHTGSVWSVAFSPNGQQVASASRDKTVILWSAATGERQAMLKGHTGSATSVAFSPDSQQVASASRDQTVILWSAATGGRQASEGHTDSITTVAFSPDGQRVASASRDRTVILWSATTGERQARLDIGLVHDLRFDLTGTQLLTDRRSFVIYPADETSSETSHGVSFGDRASISCRSSKNDCWITFNGQNLLWLPSEYHPVKFAVFGNTLAIGCSSGKILILRIVYRI